MCATAYHDVLVACGCFGLRKGAFNPVRDEDKSRLSLGRLFWDSVRKDKMRHFIRGADKSVKLVSQVVTPPAHDDRPRRFDPLFHDLSGVTGRREKIVMKSTILIVRPSDNPSSDMLMSRITFP